MIVSVFLIMAAVSFFITRTWEEFFLLLCVLFPVLLVTTMSLDMAMKGL